MKITRRQALPLFATSALVATGAAMILPGIDLVEGKGDAVAADLSTLMEAGPLGEKVIGDPDAPVTIIEYASMTCPHCRSFHVDHLPVLKEKYVDNGKAKIYFRGFPLNRPDAAAQMLAECAGDDKYFSMIDLLFERQSTWSVQGKVRDELFKIAKLAGFTQESFNTCLKDQELLVKISDRFKKASKDYEVRGTPTFFINGEKYSGGYTAKEMGEYIDGLL